MNTAKCSRICDNKTSLGFCKTTACINPMHSNIGTYQYGQGVQRNRITNADRIRSMTDEEMVEVIVEWCPDPEVGKCEYAPYKDLCKQCWLNWLQEEVQE